MEAWVALSAVVAALSFVYSVVTRRKVERDTELRNWQRVVIYTLIEEGEPIAFDELKSTYLKRAQELLSHNVPRRVIQDDSLKRILLDLQKDGVVMRRTDLRYQIQVKFPMEPSTVEELKRILVSKAKDAKQ
jgi:hypothetical protein